ncbi:hypothetical protein HMPREF0358_1823 [Escherichia coli 83972]|nr:hypothetical protein HMPREF0358_1823 [Escherichia coli 83972]
MLRVLLLCAGLSFRSGMVCSVQSLLIRELLHCLMTGCRKVLLR